MRQDGYSKVNDPGYPELNPSASFDTQPAYPPPPQYPPQNPQQYPPPPYPPNQYPPVNPGVGASSVPVGVPVQPYKNKMVCCHCQLPYEEYAIRSGIPCCILISIIILSFFLFPLLLLLLCCCQEYKVCKHCGNFTGHGESVDPGVCLC